MIEKVPPQSQEAEKASIAAMLLDKEAIAIVKEKISHEDYYNERHKVIADAIFDLYDNYNPVDLITLTEFLSERNLLDKSGGVNYLTEILDVTPTVANLSYYVELIKDKALLRKLINSCSEIISNTYEDPSDVADLIYQAEKKIFDVTQKRVTRDIVSVHDEIGKTIEHIEQIFHQHDSYTGVASGFTELDKLTSGFQKSDLIIVAARPSVGKTSFCLNIAENVAKLGKGVLVFSLEMSKDQLCLRLLCSLAKLNAHRIRSGEVGSNEWIPLTRSAMELSNFPIFIDDSSSLDVMTLASKARRLKTLNPVDLIVIDYIQLLAIGDKRRYENRQVEMQHVSRLLKALARELDVPVIALSQLSRQVESRDDRRPRLSDLRESGAIEQDADVVLFIHRQDRYEPDNPDIKGIAEINIAKQRNGPVGGLELRFFEEYTRFENFSKYNP